MTFLKTWFIYGFKEFLSLCVFQISVLNVEVSSTDLGIEGTQIRFSHSLKGLIIQVSRARIKASERYNVGKTGGSGAD